MELLLLLWSPHGGFRTWFDVQGAVAALWADASIYPVAWPGCRLGRGAGGVGSRPAGCCAFVHWHIHGLLFDDWGASAGGV